MRGSLIMAESFPKGCFLEGIISGTPKPGTAMQIKAATELVAGEFTWEVYNPSADGDPRLMAILLEDDLQGGIYSTAYVSGTRGKLYVPLPGELINILLKDVSGTGDTHAIGDRVMAEHGSGKFIVQSTSSGNGPFTLLETLAAFTADGWCLAMRS